VRSQWYPSLPTVGVLLPFWNAQTWVVVFLALLLLVFEEGAYRIHCNATSTGNLIRDFQSKHRKLPLPDTLVILSPGYKKGQPITKDMEITNPSRQLLLELSYRQNHAEFLFALLDWKGVDPREYVGSISPTPIVWSGQNPREWARDFVLHWQRVVEEERCKPHQLQYKR
jgi:hypothetical protein